MPGGRAQVGRLTVDLNTKLHGPGRQPPGEGWYLLFQLHNLRVVVRKLQLRAQFAQLRIFFRCQLRTVLRQQLLGLFHLAVPALQATVHPDFSLGKSFFFLHDVGNLMQLLQRQLLD